MVHLENVRGDSHESSDKRVGNSVCLVYSDDTVRYKRGSVDTARARGAFMEGRERCAEHKHARSAFGSIGQGDKVASLEGVVGEVKQNGFVVIIIAPPGRPPMAIGAIHPADGTSGLKEEESVRIEARWYRKEVGGGSPAH